MAHMTQEKKKAIALALKSVVPKDWKYSLAVRHHSGIVMTIKSAPVAILTRELSRGNGTYEEINHHWKNDADIKPEYQETINKIIDCLNLNNHDNSDVMTDYFDVGHYVYLQMGAWDKPFLIK